MTDFDSFVAANAASLLRTAYLITGDIHDAEDVVQDALLKVARNWPKVRRMEYPVAYTRRILVNRATSGASRRSRARRELVGERADGASVADHGERIDTQDELVNALGTLPLRQRTVLVLRYFLDLSEADVASALGCSVGTVKSTASRGLARLHDVMSSSQQPRSRIA